MAESRDSKVAVLASGGLDSAVLVAHLARSYSVVQPLYLRFGLTWESVEERYLREYLGRLKGRALRPLVTLEFPIADVYGAHWSVSGEDVPDEATSDAAVYLPGRNLLLLAKSAVWCALNGYSEVALGVLNGNPFPDSHAAFYRDLESAAARGLSVPLKFITPFTKLTKSDVVELGRDLALEWSFSCISPVDGLHCGRCNKCAERGKAFTTLSLPDPTRYAEDGPTRVDRSGLGR